MEKWNREMLSIVEQKRTGLEDAVALKDKNTEYDEVVVKVKEGQRATSVQLENEMHRLSTELIAAAEKLSELEEIIQKYKRSGKSFDSPAGDVADRKAKGKLQEGAKGGMSSLEDLKGDRGKRRSARFWNRPSHQPSRRPESMGSLSLDLLATVVHLPPLRMQLRHRNSDSSNCASVEACSESPIHHRANRILWSSGDRQCEDRRRRRREKSSKIPIITRSDSKKLHTEPFKMATPFTKSLLGLATIFPKEMYQLRGF
ncbi:uncharacterized protein LOC143373186 [Andrena cerasifolii]|uniref:uncharacterized protein LOC143373186 n=1 Tax=Andrena cerasifolii TaxID=2819439 RepID=UPI00403821B9